VILLAACNNGNGGIMQGYVEADYVDVAAGVPGRIAHLDVMDGEQVDAGQFLFSFEGEVEQSQMSQAKARLKVTRLNVKRLRELEKGEYLSRQSLDEAEAALNIAEQDAKAAAWRLNQTEQSAPVAGRVETLFYRTGEWVATGRPVVRLLPEGGMKLRFFVPESEVGDWKIGDAVSATCDGCEAPVKAHVSYIASQAEFTPPVIFSRESREKLVVMMEAKLPADVGMKLHVGQPVDVVHDGQ